MLEGGNIAMLSRPLPARSAHIAQHSAMTRMGLGADGPLLDADEGIAAIRPQAHLMAAFDPRLCENSQRATERVCCR